MDCSFAISIMKGFSEGFPQELIELCDSALWLPLRSFIFPSPYRSFHWPHLSRTLFFLMASCPADLERLERIFKLAVQIIPSNKSKLLILSQEIQQRSPTARNTLSFQSYYYRHFNILFLHINLPYLPHLTLIPTFLLECTLLFNP